MADKPKTETNLIWVHCNNCFEIYIKKNKRLFVLTCQHIACEKCAPPYPVSTPARHFSFKCPVCSNMVRGHQISDNMPTHLKEMFHPQPYLDELPTIKIMRFQAPQQAHFMQGFNRLERDVIQMEESNIILRANARKKYEELQLARAESARLIIRVREIQKQRKEIGTEGLLPVMPFAKLTTIDESSTIRGFSIASYPHCRSDGPQPHASISNTSSNEVNCFMHNHNNSFYL